MDDVAIIRTQANIGAPISHQEMERMAKRRFQNPQPQRRGAWWTMRVWRDEFVDGKHVRKQQRVRRQLPGNVVPITASDESMDLLVGANQLAGIDLVPPSAAFIRPHEAVDFPSFLVAIPFFIRVELIGLRHGYLFYPTA